MWLRTDEAANACTLTVSNTGQPFPDDVDPESPKTLGLRPVSRLIRQLEGEIGPVRRPHPVFTIRFPYPKPRVRV